MTLQQQAENLISELKLLEKLTQFGEAHVVGSVAFGTTVKPDIDLQIYTNRHYEDVATKIIDLLKNCNFTEIHSRRLKKSKKFLILSRYSTNDVSWNIDITLTQPSENYVKDSYRFFLDYFPKLTDEKRELIIKFKKEFSNVKIVGDNSAYYIYIGVLDENIKSSEEMKKYLSKYRYGK